MKKFTKIIFLLLIAFFLSIQFLLAKDTLFAPDFKLQDLHQNTISFVSFRDKQPVVLFFWTTWCPFCRSELRALNAKYPELVKDGWKILAINIAESVSKVDRFVKNYALVFEVLLDTDSAVAYAYNILGVPTYVLINKEGQIIFRENYFPQAYKELLVK